MGNCGNVVVWCCGMGENYVEVVRSYGEKEERKKHVYVSETGEEGQL